MDKKLIIGGIVAGLLVLGGVAYAVSQMNPASTAVESPSVPAEQLQNELQPKAGEPGAPVPTMPDGRPLPL